jgi:hypothetical protein
MGDEVGSGEGGKVVAGQKMPVKQVKPSWHSIPMGQARSKEQFSAASV